MENVNKMLKGMGKEILGEPWTETATSKDRMAMTIASLRYFLRRAYRQATETEDLEEFLRLVEHYGRSCVRLGGLLRRELRKGSEAERLIQEAIFQAIREVTEELGLGEEQG